MDRRDFLRVAGGAAVAAGALPILLPSSAEGQGRQRAEARTDSRFGFQLGSAPFEQMRAVTGGMPYFDVNPPQKGKLGPRTLGSFGTRS